MVRELLIWPLKFSLGSNLKGQHNNCLGCSHWWLLGPGHSRGYIGWGSCRISASVMSCLRSCYSQVLMMYIFGGYQLLCQVSLWKLLPWCHPFWTMGAHLETLGPRKMSFLPLVGGAQLVLDCGSTSSRRIATSRKLPHCDQEETIDRLIVSCVFAGSSGSSSCSDSASIQCHPPLRAILEPCYLIKKGLNSLIILGT